MTNPSPLSSRQLAALFAAPGPARFKHFISRAADGETLWTLGDATEWITVADDTGAPALPVWPHPDYAAACARDAWSGCAPAEIDVHAFMGTWLHDMTTRGLAVVVFPTPAMQGVWVTPDELGRCLADELASYD